MHIFFAKNKLKLAP